MRSGVDLSRGESRLDTRQRPPLHGLRTVTLLGPLRDLEGAPDSASPNRRAQVRLVAAGALAILIGGSYWLLAETGMLDRIAEGEALRDEILRLGAWGPLAIIGLMTTAIVMSPIPSAPIALAAGYAYGHTWGTVYVLIGAELGALIAFGLARLLGYEVLKRWFGDRLSFGLLGSQNMLMAIVFVTRLLPFLSFDLVSYAAGLTSLAAWRFALATLAGIVPASFLLAHFGGELASADTSWIMIVALGLGGLTLIPLGIKVVQWLRNGSMGRRPRAR